LIVAVALLIAACDPSIVDSTMGPTRPEPDLAATGPAVASVDIGSTTFVMHDEGDGWIALEVLHPGLQTTVEPAHLAELRESSTCGWLVEPENEDPTGCDIELPRVIYGRVTDPDIGYVCVGSLDELQEDPGFTITGTRFLERDEDGYILEAARPGEVAVPHFLTAGGTRIGDPPLDAPSDPIYRSCEAAAGIEQAERVVQVVLLVEADPSIIDRNELTIMFAAGVARGGISTSAFEGGEPVPFFVGVTPTAQRFETSLVDENHTEPIVSIELDWPDEIDALLEANEPCIGVTTIGVSFGPGVLAGDGKDITVRFIGSECGSVGA